MPRASMNNVVRVLLLNIQWSIILRFIDHFTGSIGGNIFTPTDSLLWLKPDEYDKSMILIFQQEPKMALDAWPLALNDTVDHSIANSSI
jgi:hypothetical protein